MTKSFLVTCLYSSTGLRFHEKLFLGWFLFIMHYILFHISLLHVQHLLVTLGSSLTISLGNANKLSLLLPIFDARTM